MSTVADPLDLNIDITDDEIAWGKLHPDHVQLGVMLLATRGYVVLRNAVPRPLVADLKSRFDELYAQVSLQHQRGLRETPRDEQRNGAQSVFWERGSRFRIFPKLVGPFADPHIVRNPYAVSILEASLGSDYYCKFVSSDTCVKGSTLQAPHRDIAFYNGQPVSGSLVNIPLMHCGLHNGPTEVWPGGSHLWSNDRLGGYSLSPFIQDGDNPAIETLARYLPSKKIELFPGEVMIRDPGMWHRGTPNESDEPRTMLTAGYFRKKHFYTYGDPLYNLDRETYERLDEESKALFEPFFDPKDIRFWRAKQTRALKRVLDRPRVGASVQRAAHSASSAYRRLRGTTAGSRKRR